jgi:OHCU decarboxylase
MTIAAPYPRDLVGYGRTPPHAQWPGGARLAVQFVINYEEGGENCILHGDKASEAFLSEIVGAQAWPGQRHMSMESIYEFGSRAGFWRLWRMFTQRRIPVTVFAIATALARHREAVAAMNEARWEIASHGLKWIDYRVFTAADERADIDEAVRIHADVTGTRPLGFYQGRTSVHSLDATMAEQGFLYSADSYADELPYWVDGPHGPQLIVPYTLDANDMRFATAQGFNSGDQFFAYLKDSFDVLYAEGVDRPRMLSIGLHCRLAGRPGRAAALSRFLDYVQGHDKVWLTTRLDIARHWVRTHPPAGGLRPSKIPRALFVEAFGDVFERTSTIAERAHGTGLDASADTPAGLHKVLVRSLRTMTPTEQTALLNAHPDIAGRPDHMGLPSAAWEQERRAAGLDRLTPDDLANLRNLADSYKARFGFAFVMALSGRTKVDILHAMAARLANDRDAELSEALKEVETLALARLADRLPT